MKNRTMQWGNREHLSRISLCVGLVLLFCCLGFAPALASVLELPSALTQIADEAFMNDTSITSVVIPDGTTSIGARAFAGCGNLETITIPSTVESIGEDAFEGCEGIYVAAQENSYAYNWCQEHGILVNQPMIDPTDYTFALLEDGTCEITGYTGEDKELTLPWCNAEGIRVTRIADEAFYDNTSITSVKIPAGVQEIGKEAFYFCDQMKELSLPEGILKIEECAFYSCDLLEEICIPDSVETMGEYAFGGCGLLRTINYPINWKNTTGYCSPFAASDKLTSFAIPEGVTSIPENAFYWCDKLSKVQLPDSLTYIGDYAFAECVALLSIDLPDNIKSLGKGIFLHSGLQSITLPASLESFYSSFSESDNLERVVCSEGINLIDSAAFRYCKKLKQIEFANSITEIGDDAFYECTGLTGDLKIPENVERIEREAFFNCGFDGNITLPDSLTSIGYKAFAFCKFDGTLIIPDSVTDISEGAFHDCYYLDSLVLSNQMTSIEESVFAASGFTGNLYIPEGISIIEDNAFKYCDHLQAVYIPLSVLWIGMDAFPSSITIYGVSGSYAETYAAENGIAFSTDPFPGTETEPDEETVTISGSVTFADGTPVEDAYIYVYDTIAEDWISLEYTDRNGAWACSVPADGSYTIHYLHDVYTIAPAQVSVSPTADMTLDTAIASLVGGEGTATPVFAMQMNGAEIPAEGVKVGDIVTFSITAEGATKVSLIADGVAYNEYWLTDGSAEIERSFTRAGTRQIAFQAHDGSDWGAICEAQTLIVTADGTLDAPVIHAVDTQYVGENFTVTWDAVENAESYTVYLYRNELLWPALSNTDRSTTTGLSMEIPGDLLYTDGEYLIEIIASGYGYSQSSSSVKFTVEETAAGVEITYPTDGMTYSVGDTMHTRYAMGRGTQGVRLLVTPPVGEPVLYAPDESGIFYPVADQVGDYVLTPYYSTGEGDFTADTADGAGESVTVTVQKPAISSLTQGTNEQFSIRYTGTAQDFAGSVSNARYTVKVYLDGTLVQEITPEDGEFVFTTDTLTEMGKYVYAFVACYGDIEGEPKEFPVYMVEQETESVTKYAGEPMMLLYSPGGSVKASIAYGTEVTILGAYETEYLYVSVNGKDGFIAAGSKLVEAVEPSEMNINVECLTDVPYTKLGESRQYKVMVNGAKAVYANLMQENVSVGIYEGEATTDGFIVTIPAENAGAYIAVFYAIMTDNQEEYFLCGLPFLMIDASSAYVEKECWSNHSKIMKDVMPVYTQGDAEFDVTTCKMHVVGTINNGLVYVQRTMNDGSLKYAVVNEKKLRYTKNETVYRAVCIVNPLDLEKYAGDPSEYTFENMIGCLNYIDGIRIWSALAKEKEDINLRLDKVKSYSDYNDVTYIYWTGHGLGTIDGDAAQSWGVLPKNNGHYSVYQYCELLDYVARDEDNNWEGRINMILDSCYSGDFVNTIYQNPQYHVFDNVAILMATPSGVTGRYYKEGTIGSVFPAALIEYISSNPDDARTLGEIRNNVVSRAPEEDGTIFECEPTIWGDPNRIFFAEDPDAVN